MPPTRHIQTPLLTLLLFVFALPLAAQNISVQSFDLLERDLDARVHNRVNDQNGELCALIKVVTSLTGFEWEPDALGIVKSIRKTGEYWLYVPRGARRITIKHDDLGILRNYEYPIAIRSGDVYEMVLTTADIQVIVTDPVVESQWLAITTAPKGADVYINNQLAGNTEQDFSRRYPEGEYTYRIEMLGYHDEAGVVTLRGDRVVLHFDLRPNVGNVYVTSEPESGMTIFLNGDDTGETTPATLHGISSGQHDIRLVSRWYQPKVQTITVEDNETTNVSFVMSPAFAEITIQTEPEAAIYIDDNRVAQGMHTTRLMTGVYDIAARLEKHREDKRQLHVVAGVSQEINLSPEAITGSLDITSSPIGAGIRLTDVATGRVTEQGTTPTTLRNLLIGDYEVEVKLDGYVKKNEIITISQNQIAQINLRLEELVTTSVSADCDSDPFISDDECIAIENFLEQFIFYFESKDIDAINQIFDDKSEMFVSGIERNFDSDTIVLRQVRLTKKEYLNRLKTIFRRNDKLTLDFENVIVHKSKSVEYVFGITLIQHYYSSIYSDSGYLFLMVSLENPQFPKILIRGWQPTGIPKDKIFSLDSFKH